MKADEPKEEKKSVSKRFAKESIANIMQGRHITAIFDDNIQLSYLPLSSIDVEDNIREVDIESDSFRGLVESIKEKDVIQPIIVCKKGEKYMLIAGARRLAACKALNMSSIPARIMKGSLSKEEVMAMQMIENLQREDLNPLDEAKAYYNFYKLKSGIKNIEPQEMISNIISYYNRPDKVKREVADILSAIEKTSGKSMKYAERLVSVLKLPVEAQEALKNEELNMAQAIIFVNNINHPRFFDVLAKAIKNKLTAKGIEKAFTEKKRGGGVAFFKKRVVQFKHEVEKNKSSISKQHASEILREIDEIIKILSEIADKKSASAN